MNNLGNENSDQSKKLFYIHYVKKYKVYDNIKYRKDCGAMQILDTSAEYLNFTKTLENNFSFAVLLSCLHL